MCVRASERASERVYAAKCARERLSSRQGCISHIAIPVYRSHYFCPLQLLVELFSLYFRDGTREKIALATKKHVNKRTDRRTRITSTKRLSHAQTHRFGSTVVAGAVLKQSACEIALFVCCCCCCFQLSLLLLLLSFSCCFHCNSLTFRFRPACFTIAFARLTQSVQATTSSLLLTAPTFGYADNLAKLRHSKTIPVPGSRERKLSLAVHK